MEFQKLLEERRSVRKYDGSKKVSKETVCEIISAASQAPSWKNSQTARYYCVLSDEMTEKVRTECLPGFNADRAQGAALIVTTYVSGVAGFNADGVPDNEVGNGWGCYDLGLANENLILKAKELGLDTLIMGLRDSGKLREMLSIPENEKVMAVIALGYSDVKPQKPARKSPEDIAKFY